MDNRPIGVFDSGLGGLTCVKEIIRCMPNEDIIYFGDTGRVPYGTRSTNQIIRYVRQDINFLKTFDIKYIIIACGTASSAALPLIESEYDIEITGVLNPASKAAAEKTRNGRIGVIGTEGTIRSKKFQERLLSINKDLKIFTKACPLFVPLAENGYAQKEATRLVAEDYLSDLKREGVDTLILGCTHYPLLKDVIKDILGEDVTLIDSGKEAAKYAEKRMEIKGIRADKTKTSNVRYFVSDITETFSKTGGMFLDRKIDADVEKIDIEKF